MMMPSEQPVAPRVGPKPVLGLLSLALFLLAPVATWVTVATGGTDEFGGLGVLALGMVLAAGLWVVGFLAGIVGLCRSERPRWPAVTGLILTVLAVGVLIVLYAP
jgi:hypothetical protein